MVVSGRSRGGNMSNCWRGRLLARRETVCVCVQTAISQICLQRALSCRNNSLVQILDIVGTCNTCCRHSILPTLPIQCCKKKKKNGKNAFPPFCILAFLFFAILFVCCNHSMQRAMDETKAKELLQFIASRSQFMHLIHTYYCQSQPLSGKTLYALSSPST